LDPELATLYKKNFKLQPAGDIRKVLLQDIPDHDILCAGFPCQPFSKAGEQRGLQCPQWGDLIDYVIRILRYHQPELFIIENVPNLVRHNGSRTWADIKARLQEPGYQVDDGKLSPHMFGVPQIRERAFIVGRDDSTINVGGSKVYPLAVEQFLLQQEGVVEARVFGQPNPITGFLVAAEVVLEAGVDPAAARTAILGACREGLASYQVPRVFKMVDAIAVAQSGKKG